MAVVGSGAVVLERGRAGDGGRATGEIMKEKLHSVKFATRRWVQRDLRASLYVSQRSSQSQPFPSSLAAGPSPKPTDSHPESCPESSSSSSESAMSWSLSSVLGAWPGVGPVVLRDRQVLSVNISIAWKILLLTQRGASNDELLRWKVVGCAQGCAASSCGRTRVD